MNKKQLKKLIKPIVKECVKESLLEEGLLSNIVQEVTKGVTAGMPIVERAAPAPSTTPEEMDFNKINKSKQKINEYKKGLLDAIGGSAYNGVDLFEGTEPIATQASQGSVDLGNNRDAGVDISSIIGGASQIWQSMK